ncbi:MAG: hypothetical protein Q8910_17570 [Bacteroidota bacterium]|nr:hypothetical protein [Bacteroidota bacterium]
MENILVQSRWVRNSTVGDTFRWSPGVRVIAETHMYGLNGWGNAITQIIDAVNNGQIIQIGWGSCDLNNATQIDYQALAYPSGGGACTIYAVHRAYLSAPVVLSVVKQCVLHDTDGNVLHIQNYSGTESITDEDLERLAFKSAASNPNIDISKLKALHVAPEALSPKPVEYHVDLAKNMLVTTPV